MQAIPVSLDPSFAESRREALASPFARNATPVREAGEEWIEERDADAIEVRVVWGNSVLQVAQLAPPRPFYVGEASDLSPCDVLVPASVIGAARVPLVAVEDRDAYIVLPAGAEGSIRLFGQSPIALSDAIARGIALPFGGAAGAHRVPFASVASAELTMGAFTFQLRGVRASRMVAGRTRLDRRAVWFQALSLATHAAILGTTAVFMPPLAMAEDDETTAARIDTLRVAMETLAEREHDATQLQDTALTPDHGGPGGDGERAKLDEGKMGSLTVAARNKRWGLAGPSDNADVRLPRQNSIEDARTFGAIGVLNALTASDANAPTTPWGSDDPLGRDPMSAKGNMWGPEIGDAFGAGGLGLTGIGEGGGGLGEGVGLGKLGVGHGGCIVGPCSDGQGFGRHHGFLAQGHRPAGVRMRQAGISLSGHLPPEVIQRIVRQNFGRFRLCYENGLRAQPSLQGRVAVRFVIGRDGSVSNASGSGDLPDGGVVSCVAHAFYGLSFPQPDAGIVTVTYPIVFSPSE